MAEKTGIKVGQVDFSDPQGGKGACDRKAASIKAHMWRHINEGYDVTTANEFKEAMMSSGGIKGVRIAVVDASAPSVTNTAIQVKWEGVSSRNNFRYTDCGVTAWRAYGVGTGKLVHEGGLPVQGKTVIYVNMTSLGEQL